MYKYLVVFEKTNTGYSAFVPNLPGCIASGPDRPTTEQSIYEAIQLHISCSCRRAATETMKIAGYGYFRNRGLKEEKEEIPSGTAESEVFVFSSEV
jgi:hypothetical protein